MRLAIINAKEYILAHLDDAEDWRGQTLAALVGAMVGDRDRYKRDLEYAIETSKAMTLEGERLYQTIRMALAHLESTGIEAPRLFSRMRAAMRRWDKGA